MGNFWEVKEVLDLMGEQGSDQKYSEPAPEVGTLLIKTFPLQH